jgi:hypothetical protein
MTDKSSKDQQSPHREHLGIMFECCRVYTRIYRNKAGNAYVGWCPRCAKKVTIPISPLGTDSRFFKVY